jgi:UPF0042 nucleotide-binding protein
MKADKELIVITGMSGAGKSTVAHALEDCGWYVVDNLPPSLISELFEKTDRSLTCIAVVVDVRGREFFDDLNRSLSELEPLGIKKKILFVDASDDSLVRRFESTRRPHPLSQEERILDGINNEREKLRELRSGADIVIDTSELNIHQLDKRIGELFGGADRSELKINLLSFGYKYGIPLDADLVMDCRFIANPHWDPLLRPLSGLDQPVRDRVLESEEVKKFLHHYLEMIESVIPGYVREGKKFITLAIGCTGGKHRSVAISEEIGRELASRSTKEKMSIKVLHRDLGRER